MADAYLGQIELFAFGFVPRGWIACAGQTLPIAQNQALFGVLGTTFGGDGRNTFALPNLQGRLAVGVGGGFVLGEAGGEEQHQLTGFEVAPEAPHNHQIRAASNVVATTATPTTSSVLSKSVGLKPASANFDVKIYGPAGASPGSFDTEAIVPFGGVPHENRMPCVALNYCINASGPVPTSVG